MNICIHCKHVLVHDNTHPEFSRCTFGAEISPVTGKPPMSTDLPYCKVNRLSVGPCGPVGANYEAKHEEIVNE
jgi:hypothetical protein